MGKKERNIAIGAAIAAGAGYVAGILSAPRSGRRTRKRLANTANKAKTDAEKQLKELHTDLKNQIAFAEKKVTKAKTKANDDLKKATANAKVAKDKVRMILTAIHDGDAEDPDLKKMVEEGKKAKANLAKFLKKK